MFKRVEPTCELFKVRAMPSRFGVNPEDDDVDAQHIADETG